MATEVVNLRDNPMGADVVRIDRKTRWGNPYRIGPDGTREEVITKYRTWLQEQISESKITVADMANLHGKRLACWCKPKACHGDVLAEMADWSYSALWPHK